MQRGMMQNRFMGNRGRGNAILAALGGGLTSVGQGMRQNTLERQALDFMLAQRRQEALKEQEQKTALANALSAVSGKGGFDTAALSTAFHTPHLPHYQFASLAKTIADLPPQPETAVKTFEDVENPYGLCYLGPRRSCN